MKALELRGRALSGCILGRDPLLIVAGNNRIKPITMRQVPTNGLAHAAAEALARLPAQFPPQLAGIDRVSPIMTRTIRDKLNQRLVWTKPRLRDQLVE